MSAWRYTLLSGAGLACALPAFFVAACATVDETASLDPEKTDSVVPERDAGGADGAVDSESCSGSDCEFFPAECEPDALCPGGLFSADPAVGADWRARIETIRARSATDAWVVGTVGMAAHFDGTDWKSVDVGTYESLAHLWLADGGELAFGTVDRVFSRGLGPGEDDPSPDGWSKRGKGTPPTPPSPPCACNWTATSA